MFRALRQVAGADKGIGSLVTDRLRNSLECRPILDPEMHITDMKKPRGHMRPVNIAHAVIALSAV